MFASGKPRLSFAALFFLVICFLWIFFSIYHHVSSGKDLPWEDIISRKVVSSPSEGQFPTAPAEVQLPIRHHHRKEPNRHNHHVLRHTEQVQDSHLNDGHTSQASERRNISGDSLAITKRAPGLVDLYAYQCRGDKYLTAMKAAKPDPPKWTFNDLAKNGWEGFNAPKRVNIGIEIQQALFKFHVPREDQHSFDLHVDLMEAFNNIHGVLKEPRGGDYFNRYILPTKLTSETRNTESASSFSPGAIVGLQNYSPRYYAAENSPLSDEAEILAAIPPMHNWANIVWAIWEEVTKSQAGHLRYIFHDNIVTDTTLHVMEAVEGIREPKIQKSLRLRWPGHTYDVDSPMGLALLGTPHGVGTAWMYINGRKALSRREEVKVTVFTGQVFEDRDTGVDAYYLLWDLGPRGDG